MKILVISHEYPPIGGGGATACKNLSAEFVKENHYVEIITADLNGVYSKTCSDNLIIHKVKCKRMHSANSSFLEMLTFLLSAYNKAKKVLRENPKFDVVLINFGIPSGPIGYLIKKKYHIPYVVRVGGGDIPGTQKRFAFVYKFISPLLKMIWLKASYVVTNSNGLMDRGTRFYSKAKHNVIYNGINIEDFPTKKERNDNEDFCIVTTARIVERKGIQHVITSLKPLVEKYGSKIQYTIIGDGPYRSQIEALSEKYNVLDNVSITGMVSRGEVMEKLQHADVFVLTSHWEGMPNVVLEAMAMHLPIVMSNCEGSDELIRNNGIKVDLGEEIDKQLFNAIDELICNTELRKKMSMESYKMAKYEFSWQQCAKSYISLFEHAIENNVDK